MFYTYVASESHQQSRPLQANILIFIGVFIDEVEFFDLFIQSKSNAIRVLYCLYFNKKLE